MHKEDHGKSESNLTPKYKKQKTLTKQITKHKRSEEERVEANLLCPVIAVYKVTNEGKM
jgi:hypothetical protein